MGRYQDMVATFMDKIGQKVNTAYSPADHEDERSFRRELLREEYGEYEEAELHAFSGGEGDTPENILDAMADMMVIMYGTACAYGMDLDGAFLEVMRSNNTKFNEDGSIPMRKDGKGLKGPNYEPPQLTPFLRWNRRDIVLTGDNRTMIISKDEVERAFEDEYDPVDAQACIEEVMNGNPTGNELVATMHLARAHAEIGSLRSAITMAGRETIQKKLESLYRTAEKWEAARIEAIASNNGHLLSSIVDGVNKVTVEIHALEDMLFLGIPRAEPVFEKASDEDSPVG